jgi:hypothetical protein
MLSDLVHEFDDNLLAIVKTGKMLRTARKMEGKCEKDEVGTLAQGLIDSIEEAYIDATENIVVRLWLVMFYAIVAKILDLLLGPLQWKHLTILYARQIAFVVLSKRKHVEPDIMIANIMIAILSIMPRVISGSLTRLFGIFFSLWTIGGPLLMHTLENISDRTEVRWVLIGLLLDLIYLGTAALISQANDFGLRSIGLIVSVCVGEYVLLNAGVVVIFKSGPWDVFFWRISPLLEFLKSSTRFAVQLLLLFVLNRFTRYLFATLFAPRSRYLSVYLRLRHILYGTNSLNNTAHVKDTNPDVYQELPEEKTIRVLQVLQGWPSQKLECKFKIIQLGGSDSYEAVSYVWGDPSATHSIVVNGQHLQITKSAYDIIHRRRSALVDQFIWIDQICINQNNAKEKASQVQMMGQI